MKRPAEVRKRKMQRCKPYRIPISLTIRASRRGPTADELANDFAPESLLDIARRRNFPVRLSQDREHVEVEVDAPFWFVIALQIHEPDLVDLMKLGFLGNWRRSCRQ
jgi:hypothetical protein